MVYPAIKEVEIFNFMSIKHAHIMFDGTNIINIKGYNDSGKSAILRAVIICLADQFKTVQAKYIMHGCEFFRVVVTFEDGISIVRDKYSTGQSLYEMYKGRDLLFTTKSGKTLTKVSGVPKPIEDYIGLCMTESGCLNYQNANNTKMLLVETTGSENYRELNTVLKSEEIAKASVLINSDRNDLSTAMQEIQKELSSKQETYNERKGITQELVDAIGEKDKQSEGILEKDEFLKNIIQIYNSIVSMKNVPTVDEIDENRLQHIEKLSDFVENEDNFRVYPKIDSVENVGKVSEIEKLYRLLSELENTKATSAPTVKKIDTYEKIESIEEIYKYFQTLTKVKVTPNVEPEGTENISKLNSLDTINQTFDNFVESLKNLKKIEMKLTKAKDFIEKLVLEADRQGIKMQICPNCGTVVEFS